jgi:autotransporter-associated beta strand protein
MHLTGPMVLTVHRGVRLSRARPRLLPIELACALRRAIRIIAAVTPRLAFCAMILTVSFGPLSVVCAGSATWRTNPSSNDWNTATNWLPRTVPNGTDDIATFGVSNVTEITQSMTTTLGGIQFEPGASSYNIDVGDPNSFSLNDAGVTNDSGVTQSISCSNVTLDFYNTSAAGDNVIYTSTTTDAFHDSQITFHDHATAGSATLITQGFPTFGVAVVSFRDNSSAGSSHMTAIGDGGTLDALGVLSFDDDSTAAESTITLNTRASAGFGGRATAANSTITCSLTSFVTFGTDSTAATATITCADNSNFYFGDSSTAGAAKIICSDALYSTFNQNSTAGTATITYSNTVAFFFDFATAGAATLTSSAGSSVFFDEHSTAGAATFSVDDSTLDFQSQSDGGTARIILTNAGTLIVGDKPLVFNLGSLEGDGTTTATINRVALIGGNNLDATFSGTLESSVEGDWLTKVGTGTWTLAGMGSYPGSTTVTAGALLVTSASTPTGSGPVKVNAGTLGGSGTIAGPVTIGTGSGTGAFLAPAYGGNKRLTLTIEGSLTFNSDATYTYTFKAKGNRSRIDKVIANGVTINSGAKIALSGTAQGQLTEGLVLTLIKNTAATPIAGTFSNLPNGATVTVNGNNLKASYSGGDGNDLTLTVVP